MIIKEGGDWSCVKQFVLFVCVCVLISTRLRIYRPFLFFFKFNIVIIIIIFCIMMIFSSFFHRRSNTKKCDFFFSGLIFSNMTYREIKRDGQNNNNGGDCPS